MGVVDYVGFDKYPKQGAWLGKRVEVCFNYDTDKKCRGNIVREDEDHELALIKLDDGRIIKTTECQYRLLYNGKEMFSLDKLEEDKEGISAMMYADPTIDNAELVVWCGATKGTDDKWRLPNGEIVEPRSWVKQSIGGEFFINDPLMGNRAEEALPKGMYVKSQQLLDDFNGLDPARLIRGEGYLVITKTEAQIENEYFEGIGRAVMYCQEQGILGVKLNIPKALEAYHLHLMEERGVIEPKKK